MASLADIRAKLAQMEPKKNGEGVKTDGSIYPFWNIEEGQTATVRFLPDADPNNVFFWVERKMIKLTFPGVKGGQNKPVTVQVPCGEMWGDSCPVLTEVRPWFKANDPALEELGRKYWMKRSYIFQGLVVDNPLKEEGIENPIRRFIVSPQLFNIIKSALMSTEMENVPTDYKNGTDFRITKTTKGQYADYTTSVWSRRDRALNDEELQAIDTHQLYNLADFLPARPTADHYRAIAEMFEASVAGELYDVERWGNFYKPYGVDLPNSGNSTTPAASAPAQAKAAPAPDYTQDDYEEPAPAPARPAPSVSAPAPAESGKKSADDILAMIRNRKA